MVFPEGLFIVLLHAHFAEYFIFLLPESGQPVIDALLFLARSGLGNFLIGVRFALFAFVVAELFSVVPFTELAFPFAVLSALRFFDVLWREDPSNIGCIHRAFTERAGDGYKFAFRHRFHNLAQSIGLLRTDPEFDAVSHNDAHEIRGDAIFCHFL